MRSGYKKIGYLDAISVSIDPNGFTLHIFKTIYPMITSLHKPQLTDAPNGCIDFYNTLCVFIEPQIR